MIGVTCDVKISQKKWDKLSATLMGVVARKVAVIGIPSTAKPPSYKTKVGTRGGSRRVPSMINMATLGYIMEKGRPVDRITPRPFMQQTWDREGSKVKKKMENIYRRICKGKDVTKQLQRLAIGYQGQMRYTFTSGTFKPNAPITTDGGWMRNHKSGKPVYITGKQSTKPLIDHGNLRRSIKGWVRDR